MTSAILESDEIVYRKNERLYILISAGFYLIALILISISGYVPWKPQPSLTMIGFLISCLGVIFSAIVIITKNMRRGRWEADKIGMTYTFKSCESKHIQWEDIDQVYWSAWEIKLKGQSETMGITNRVNEKLWSPEQWLEFQRVISLNLQTRFSLEVPFDVKCHRANMSLFERSFGLMMIPIGFVLIWCMSMAFSHWGNGTFLVAFPVLIALIFLWFRTEHKPHWRMPVEFEQ